MAGITTLFLCVAVVGYWAYGNAVGGFLLAMSSHPSWLLMLCNLMVVIQLLVGEQVRRRSGRRAAGSEWQARAAGSVRAVRGATGMLPPWAVGLQLCGQRSAYVSAGLTPQPHPHCCPRVFEYCLYEVWEVRID